MRISYKVRIRTQISRAKFRQILRLFAVDLTAVQIAELVPSEPEHGQPIFDIDASADRFIL